MSNEISPTQIYFLYILSGILLGVGFIFPYIWILALLGIALFIFLIDKSTNSKTVIWGGFFTWTIKSLFAISWFWSTYPINWIDVSLGKTELVVIGIYWLVAATSLGLIGILISIGWWTIKKYFPVVFGLIFFPLLWLLSEFLGSYLFSLVTYGDGGTINTYFSYGYLGYLLAEHNLLLMLAKFGGVYILSFTAVFFGYLICLTYKTFSRYRSIPLILFVLLIIWISGLDYFSAIKEYNKDATDSVTRIAVIDTQISNSYFDRKNRELYKYQQVSEAVEKALSLDVNYIILPEDSRYTGSRLSPESSYRIFRFQNSDPSAIVIDSGRVESKDKKVYLRAVIFDGINKSGTSIEKQYLVPQGEFMPYFTTGSLTLLGLGRVATEISNKLLYRPGTLGNQDNLAENIPAILFCFESTNPSAVRKLLQNRKPPFVAHIISHAWFHESKILEQQQDSMLKVQALWNNINIVSAANMAHGALYTPSGKKIQPTTIESGESWRVSLVEF